MQKKSVRGFTLIEILIVIGIIAILAGVVLVAINPARQFAQANDTQRVSNLNAILNAIGQRIVDGKGIFDGGPTTCPTLPTATSSILSSGTAGSGQVLLSCLVPTYIPALPSDPTATGNDTGYDLIQDSVTGRITVIANGQITNPIQVTR